MPQKINLLISTIFQNGGDHPVGIATQPEQQINLEHLMNFGMAERISHWDWRAKQIRAKVSKIIINKNIKKKP